jgi:hypothetical protein
VPAPFVKDAAEKIAPLGSSYGKFGQMPRVFEFHTLDILVVIASQFIAQKAVDLERLIDVGLTHQSEDIKLGLAMLQMIDALDNRVVTSYTAHRRSIPIVGHFGTVKTDSNEKPMPRQELSPFRRELGSIRLQPVGYQTAA